MRESPRLTDIHLVSPADLGDERRLYEMGIPVDTIACPWDVDIMQKIPLGESRDTVKASYITKVYTVILNDRHQNPGARRIRFRMGEEGDREWKCYS